MKVRFVRDSFVYYIASQISVDTDEQLFDAIRTEKKLAKDFILNAENVKISPAKEPDTAFDPRYQIYVLQIGLVGYCDGPLKDIQEKNKVPVPEGPYYIDTDRAEHTCCWNSAIVRPPTEQEKKQRINIPVRILECSKADARMIRNALNTYHNLQNQNGENQTPVQNLS